MEILRRREDADTERRGLSPEELEQIAAHLEHHGATSCPGARRGVLPHIATIAEQRAAKVGETHSARHGWGDGGRARAETWHRLYVTGRTLAEVGAEFGVSSATVHGAFTRYNLPMRRASGGRRGA